MASPPEIQRGIGDRGTGSNGTNQGSGKLVPASSQKPSQELGKAVSVNPLSTVCSDFVFIDEEKSNAAKGTGVHRVIREQLTAHFVGLGYGSPVQVSLSDASFDPYRDKVSIKGGGKREGTGYIDLAFKQSTGNLMLLAEIKPANWKQLLAGETQLTNYIEKANGSEYAKRKYNVQQFASMPPIQTPLPPVVDRGTWFELRWCLPGIILYKEVRKQKDEGKEKKKQKEEMPKRSSASLPWGLKIIGSLPRGKKLEAWTPDPLRRAIQATSLADGLYRDRFSAIWPSGYTTNVVVWVKRWVAGTEFQYYQEFPTDPAFYQGFAKRWGLSSWQGDLIRKTLVDWNSDMWSLIAPDAQGVPSRLNPYLAREELRSIYAGILKGVIFASSIIIGAGAGVTSTSNAMSQRGTSSRSIGPETTQPTKETPQPGWVSKSVGKGAGASTPSWVFKAAEKGADAFAEFEKAMRVTP